MYNFFKVTHFPIPSKYFAFSMENESNLRQKKCNITKRGVGQSGGDPVASAEDGRGYWEESVLWSTWVGRGFGLQAG